MGADIVCSTKNMFHCPAGNNILEICCQKLKKMSANSFSFFGKLLFCIFVTPVSFYAAKFSMCVSGISALIVSGFYRGVPSGTICIEKLWPNMLLPTGTAGSFGPENEGKSGVSIYKLNRL